MTTLFDPRWAPHVDGARQVNDALREMGDLIPVFETPEQVGAMRAIPEAYRTIETALPLHDRTIPGPAGGMRLRVAAAEGKPAAVYLDIHGGGFCMGWPEMHDEINARLARATGITVVSLDYRLAPEHPFPAGPDDCRAAADWLLANAESEFGSSRLVIGGDSAGGNLTMHVALHLRERCATDRVAGMNLTYGIYDLSGTPSARNLPPQPLVLTARAMDRFHDAYAPGRDHEGLRDPAISPLYADVSGLPAALLTVGTLDPLLDDSLFMAARLRAAGNPAELYVVPESPHGFGSFPGPMAAELELLTQEWVRERLAS
jgi:acetyl esterase/lipase